MNNKYTVEDLANIIAEGIEAMTIENECKTIASEMKAAMNKQDIEDAISMATNILNARGVEKPDRFKDNVLH